MTGLLLQQCSIALKGQPLLHEVSLAIQPGTTHVLMGPNGSGKSSLALAIMGHPSYQKTTGTMMFNGCDMSELSPDKRAKLGIYLSMQQPPEIPGVSVFTFLKESYDALRGIAGSVQEMRALIEPLLGQVQLPLSFLDRSLHEGFSGGEKKRLEILQFLLFKPRLIILDEIDSGLDSDGLKMLGSALQKLQAEDPAIACLIITHYTRLLSHINPDVVHVMQAGTIKVSGDNQVAHLIEEKGYDAVSHL